MKNPVMRACSNESIVIRFFSFSLVVVDVHHHKWKKNIPPHTIVIIFTHILPVSAAWISYYVVIYEIYTISIGHGSILFSLLFYYSHFVCYFPRFFFKKKTRRKTFIAETHRKVTVQWTMILCECFNLDNNNVNKQPKTYIF